MIIQYLIGTAIVVACFLCLLAWLANPNRNYTTTAAPELIQWKARCGKQLKPFNMNKFTLLLSLALISGGLRAQHSHPWVQRDTAFWKQSETATSGDVITWSSSLPCIPGGMRPASLSVHLDFYPPVQADTPTSVLIDSIEWLCLVDSGMLVITHDHSAIVKRVSKDSNWVDASWFTGLSNEPKAEAGQHIAGYWQEPIIHWYFCKRKGSQSIIVNPKP